MPTIKTTVARPGIPPRPTLADQHTFDVTIAAANADEVTGEQAGEILAGIPADGMLCLSAAAVTVSS